MKKWITFFVLMIGAISWVRGQVLDSAALIKTVDSLIQVSRTLTGQRIYDKALEVNAVAEKLALEKLGRETAAYGSCCFNRGRVFRFSNNFQEAEKWYLEAIAIRVKVLGKEHLDYASSLNNLAVLYKEMGKYEKAEPLYLETIAIRGKVLGKEHPDYATALNNLAILYKETGKYEKAESLYLEATAIREKVLGKEHPDYASSLNNLAGLYFEMDNYAKAESLYLETKAIRKKVLGKEHPDYASTLNNLASLYSDMGIFEKVEPLLLESRDIREKVLGKQDPDYASSLNNLAILYRKMGLYGKTESLLQESKAIRAKVLGKEHPDYALSLNSLANLYNDKGDLAKAEQLYLDVIEIRAKSLGKEHPGYASSLNSLATLYKDKGDNAKAEPLYLEALAIVAKSLGKETRNYAGYLYNLAYVYSHKGEYDKAEPMFLEAKEIFAKVLGKEHPEYANSLTNLGNLYYYLGDYNKAAPYYLEAKEVCKKALGKECSEYAQTLSNLANLYRDQGDYAEADSLYLEANQIFIKTLGRENPTYNVFLEYLGVYYQKTKRISEASTLFLETNEFNRGLIEKSAAYASESQMLAYLHTFDDDLGQFQSFAQIFPSLEFNRASFDNALFYSGFLLENARRLSSSVAEADSSTRETYERWQGCRRRLAKEYAKPIVERRHITEVEAAAEAYEKTLTTNLPRFGQLRKVFHWQDVRDHLQPGEAAIEFLRYKYYSPDETDSTMYGVLILRPNWEQPRFVPLFEERELTQAFNCQGMGDSECAAKRYSNKKVSPVYRLVWQPLDSMLLGVKTVYYAPAGQLHLLDFGALNTGRGKRLANQYHLVRLGSTRQLAVPDDEAGAKPQNLALLFGGVRYDADSTDLATAVERLDTLRFFKPRGQEIKFDLSDTTLRSMDWGFLEGSQKEVENIQPLLEINRIPTHTFSGAEATEEAFKRIGQNTPPPRILHIATHGFFFPSPDSEKGRTSDNKGKSTSGKAPAFALSEHPMIRSGLVLAGANYAWQHGKPFRDSMEDGILTAYEISQMNLQGTELVVLSACQTGLGDLENNEGVYGLQRAFKIAGARYLIMSLQRVPDGPTQEFMTLFYKKWLGKKRPLPDAFRSAQSAMRKKYPDQPLNWSGWVLVE